MKLLILLTLLFVFTSTKSNTSIKINKDSLHVMISKIENKYHIKVYYNTPLPDSIYDTKRKYVLAPDSDYVKLFDYVRLFEREFNKYPVEFIQKTNLRSIIIVQEVTNTDGALRTAVPDRENEVLYLQYPQKNYYPDYYKHTIHHEFYHMIEEEIYGTSFYKDPVWAMFNDTSFHYGNGGNSMYDKKVNTYKMDNPIKGFINLYSTSAIEEDKAEIYAILFVDLERKKLEEFAKTDKILEEKINYMKHFICTISNEFREFMFEER